MSAPEPGGQRREVLMAVLGGSTVEDPVHVYPQQDPFGHTGEDQCPCGPVLRKVEWPEITYWAMVHPALVPEQAYRVHGPGDTEGGGFPC